MKGLIIKDLECLYERKAYLLLFYIFIFGAGVLGRDLRWFLIMSSLYVPAFVYTTFYRDEVSRWKKYSICLPVDRSEIVYSKYILGSIVLGVILLSAVVIGIVLYFKDGVFFSEVEKAEIVLLLFVLILGQAILLAIAFSTNSQNALYSVLPIVMLNATIINFTSAMDYIGAYILKYWYILIAIAIVFVLLSVKVSINIMEKKEF